jgi:hypothetical protein
MPSSQGHGRQSPVEGKLTTGPLDVFPFAEVLFSDFIFFDAGFFSVMTAYLKPRKIVCWDCCRIS